MELEQLVKQRQALKDEQDEINGKINALNAQIAGILESEGLSKLNVGHWSVTARRTKRYKSDLASQIMAKKKISKSLREQLYKAPEYDPAKLKALYPKEWEAARVEDTNATVTINEVKP